MWSHGGPWKLGEHPPPPILVWWGFGGPMSILNAGFTSEWDLLADYLQVCLGSWTLGTDCLATWGLLGFLWVSLSSLFLWCRDYECPWGILIENPITHEPAGSDSRVTSQYHAIFRESFYSPLWELWKSIIAMHLGSSQKASETGRLSAIRPGRRRDPFRTAIWE